MSKMKEWLKTTHYKDYRLEIASSDASFRQYYRLSEAENSVIVMDSSLEKESLTPFVDITSRLQSVGVKAPKILEQNLEDGFLILEDFGNIHYLNLLNEKNFEELYIKAIDEIVKIQKAPTDKLPLYDKDFLHFEMSLMQEWYLEKKLSISLTNRQKDIIHTALEDISNVVLSQPQDVFVHRDYHSRNIMLKEGLNIGVIDYQDAMSGAITYDLVSLLKDCYIEFDREKIEGLVLLFRDKLGLKTADKEFIKWFDFMGMQRHIKVLGVFSRLDIRDGKDGYLKDIPLTLKYTLQTAQRYKETEEFAKLLKELTL